MKASEFVFMFIYCIINIIKQIQIVVDLTQILHCVKGVHTQSFFGPYFPVFGLNTERYSVSLRILSECRKMRNRTTPNRKIFRSALLIRQKTNKKESIINSINKKDNNFFKRSVIVSLNNEEIKKDPQRITKTKNKKKK